MNFVALDVDGVLVNSEGIVYPEISTALKRQWNNAHFVLTSGRPCFGVEYILKQIGCDGYYIALNGAVVMPAIGTTPIYKEDLSVHDLEKIIAQINEFIQKNEYHVAVFAYTVVDWIAWGYDMAIQEETMMIDHTPVVVDRLHEITREGIIKVVVVCDNQNCWDEVTEFLNANLKNCSVNQSRKYYVEITNPKVSKGNAINFLASRLGVAKTISVGDGRNDISMFEASNISYAVNTAPDIVKKQATFILQNPTTTHLADLIDQIGIQKIEFKP